MTSRHAVRHGGAFDFLCPCQLLPYWRSGSGTELALRGLMIPTLQTFFGLTMPLSNFPVAPETARALAERIRAAARSMQGSDVPVALAAEFRRDAERYLAVRRTRELRLPTSLEITCDESARALMSLTANTPPGLRPPERLVA